MHLRNLTIVDESGWLVMRQALWPNLPADQLRRELAQIAADPRQVAIGAFDGDYPVAFVELSIHPHAVGCRTSPVGYLEAWYVNAEYRRTGVGRRLVAAGEDWVRAQGCTELASDTWLNNPISNAAHLALGFTESERLVHYRKML